MNEIAPKKAKKGECAFALDYRLKKGNISVYLNDEQIGKKSFNHQNEFDGIRFF